MRKLIVILLFPFLFACSPTEENADLEIHFIDVGYGDAVLLKNAQSRAILIDTGYPEARAKLIAYLRKQKVDELEHLIVTHPHPDHLGNAVAVLTEFKANNLRDNGQALDHFDERLTEQLAHEYEEEFRGRPSYRVLSAGDKIEWGSSRLDVLWPEDVTSGGDWNTNSLLIRLSCGKLRALLAGDFNRGGEIQILRQEGLNLKSDLLKVGHHGAGDATGETFLKAVSPRWAVISVGENPWGYPSAGVLQRLRESGAEVFRTDRDGSIIFRYLPSGEIEILASGKVRREMLPR